MALLGNILYKEDIQKLKPDFSVIQTLDEDRAKELQTLPFMKEKNIIKIITTNNFPEELRWYIRTLQNQWLNIDIIYTTTDWFQEAMKWYAEMSKRKTEAKQQQNYTEQAKWQSAIDLLKGLFASRETMEPGVFVMEVIRLAFQAWASDLHFQSEKTWTKVRIRIDGILSDVVSFENQTFEQYISKIKFISGVKMNISEKPQDGRFSFKVKDNNGIQRDIDARVNFMPWVVGDSIVIRFLDGQNAIRNFSDIWITNYNFQKIEKTLKNSSGIFILSWPTGSWKTTTLYSILNYLNDGRSKIITFEDPIEYTLEGIQQSQINDYKGYTFEEWMKAVLRHDPDTILVWETRNKETANISINASLTGHRVLTTLHVNSAIETITRLNNMGVESYMLGSSLNAIASQRLVRKICPHCKAKKEFDSQKKELLKQRIMAIQNINPNFFQEVNLNMNNIYEYYWVWCDKCNNTWFSGRVAIFEILEISDAIRKAIVEKENSSSVYGIARQEWFITLQEDGIVKVLSWLTTIEEILRVSG